jgi:hypothetical protein
LKMRTFLLEQHSHDIVPFVKLKPRTLRKANTYCWPGAFESIVGDRVDVEDENIPLRATFLWQFTIEKLKPCTFRKAILIVGLALSRVSLETSLMLKMRTFLLEQHSYAIVPFVKLKPRTLRKANTYCWPGAFESIVGDLVDVEDENIPLRDRWLCHLLLLLSGHAPRHSRPTEELNKTTFALFLLICLRF